MHVDATLTLRSATIAASTISQRLAIEPDHSWEPGDSLARRRSPRTTRCDHGWAVRAVASDPDRALADLLVRIEAGAGALGDLMAEGETRVDVVLLACDGPGDDTDVEAGVTRLAATLGAGLVACSESAAGSARLLTWTSAAPSDVGT